MSKQQKIEFIKNYREQQGLTQFQMAAKFDIGGSTLANWEQGRYEIPNYFVNLLARVKN